MTINYQIVCKRIQQRWKSIDRRQCYANILTWIEPNEDQLNVEDEPIIVVVTQILLFVEKFEEFRENPIQRELAKNVDMNDVNDVDYAQNSNQKIENAVEWVDFSVFVQDNQEQNVDWDP